ncbi:peptidyl-prolyl cis-trans isomerase D [Orbus hercynius]|uniref:Peptidyl-prolyl cis-trans isomerase D n=1 Tax=Orbus hercynius TaxID=593135 RepID=A0A495RBN4_9GAMM|nr:SurA N-terminal domain-containing protein [Orbus hercynius]RKS84741.1 peptidyl-prolyl cis-trans isomerase D [Orbus hercynius]
MMEKIRTAANSVIVKIIFSIIILAFIFTGFSGFLGLGSSHADDARIYIAKVNGEGLSRSAFEAEAQAAERNAGTVMGDDAFIKMLRSSVLAGQIDNFLSYQLAESLGTKISDQQVKNIIRQQPVFFKNGRFNNQLYLELLAANHYTPDAYANSLRSSILQKQVMDALLLSNFVLPTDSDISILENQVRNVYLTNYSIANIDNDEFTVSDDEMKNYYDKNQQEFFHKKRLKMKYITNFLPAIETDTQVTREEIQQHYDQNKPGSFSPEKRFYSFLSFDSLPSAQQEYNTLKQQSTKDRLAIPMDKIGWLNMDDKLPELLHNTKLAKAGEISKPVEQDGIYYIVRLDQVINAKKLPFDYAAADIKSIIYKDKVDKQFQTQQEKLEQSADLPTMEAIAEASGLELYTSNWTYEKESFSIGRFPEIHDEAFSDEMIVDGKPTGKISAIIPIQKYQASYIIQVTDYQDEGISSFEDVKDTIKAKLLAEKKKAVFAKDVEAKLAQLKETGSVKGISFSQRIALTQDITDERIDPKTVQEVFAVVPSVNDTTFGASIISDEQAQFFIITDVQYPKQVEDLSEKLQPELLQLFSNYLAQDLRSNAKIEIMPDVNM